MLKHDQVGFLPEVGDALNFVDDSGEVHEVKVAYVNGELLVDFEHNNTMYANVCRDDFKGKRSWHWPTPASP